MSRSGDFHGDDDNDRQTAEDRLITLPLHMCAG